MEIREFSSSIVYHLPGTVQFDKKSSQLGKEFFASSLEKGRKMQMNMV